MTPVPDFPSELVEAAAKAAMEAEPGQNWECATAKEADVYLRDSLAVLAVVVPLIEQRVIDRLAGEAGGPPYEEWNPTRAVWLEAVACGVAAERERGDKLREAVAQALVVLGSAEWFAACASQPCPSCDPSGEGVEIGGEIKGRCRESIDQLRAALAPERTTTPDSMTGVEPVTDGSGA